MHRRAPQLAAVVILAAIVGPAGCEKQAADAGTSQPPAGGAAVADVAPAPDPKSVPSEPQEPRLDPAGEGVLDGLELGDRACYVQLDTGGTKLSVEGAFELCPGGSRDAAAMVGKRVKWKTERTNVMAASCEGNPDCKQSDVVDAIVSLSLAGGAAITVTLDTLDGTNAEATLGKPASKHTETWEMDGGRYTTWKWQGVELITAESGAAQLVQCEAPCALGTAQGIVLGKTDAEVRKLYGDGINRQLSNKKHIVVGDEYGGTAFDLKDGKVVRIVVGTWAE